MNRLTVFIDIAGRPTREVTGSPRVTAAALVVASAGLDALRALVPTGMEKWKSIDVQTAMHVVGVLRTHGITVAASTVNRDNAAWVQALHDEEILQQAIVGQSRKPAGWVKLPVLLVYELLGRACTRGLAHSLLAFRGRSIVDRSGSIPIQCDVVCDEEISGEENIEVFKSFWLASPKSFENFGFKIQYPEVILMRDEDEPLLRVADIVAGLIHSAHLIDPGRLPMPIDCATSRELLQPLLQEDLLSIDAFDFDASYDQIFGDVMSAARCFRER